MRVTKENLSDIERLVEHIRLIPMNERLKKRLLSLLIGLDEINAMSSESSRMFMDYEDKHTEYSPERVDPCPDWYGLFTLRWENEPYETIGDYMTLEELDTTLCVIYDFVEHNNKSKTNKNMERKCLSCRQGQVFCDGMCKCHIEPSDSNTHYDDYCCDYYDAVTEEAYEERVAWKLRQEKEKKNQEQNPVQINLNEYVWVELNEHGWKMLTDYYKKMLADVYAFGKPAFSVWEYLDLHKKQTTIHAIDGVERNLTRFQLHEFMHIFGSKLYAGAENVCEGNNLFW